MYAFYLYAFLAFIATFLSSNLIYCKVGLLLRLISPVCSQARANPVHSPQHTVLNASSLFSDAFFLFFPSYSRYLLWQTVCHVD